MSTRTHARRWIVGAVAVALAPGMALSAASVAVAAPAPDPVVASGSDWSVTTTPGGYLVDLKLDEPLPMVNDAPTIIVDGEPLGLAQESEDGLSLSIVTNDASVADATDVSKGWSSGEEDKASETTETPVTEESPQSRIMTEQLDALAQAAAVPDPSTLGQYGVTEAEYDFGDQAIALAAIGGIRGEMTGKMYLTDATGERPTIVLLHGRHTSCSGQGANPLRWPCGPTQMNVRSYLGYEGTARALASNGYNVLSIAANSVNSNDNQLALDYGAQARGQLILDTLSMLEKANAGAAVSYDDITTATDTVPSVTTTRTLDEALVRATTRTDQPAAPSGVTAASLKGRFDLDHVGIMGHSRGGEGVVSAATLNQGLAKPFGIESVLPLAPVDFGRMTLPDVPTAVFLPYCDGDVSNQQGQHFIDDSRHAFDDNVLRSAVWVMGANHNFFNTVWTPGLYPAATSDDWSTRDTTSSCSTRDATRLTAAQQYQVGVSYMTGFFRLTMGGETQFQSLFDGSVKPSTTATSYADVRVMATQPASSTSLVTDFTTNNSLIRVSGGATAAVCTNLSGRTVSQSLPFCATTKGSSQVPHWTPGSFAPNVPEFPTTRFLWTGASTTDPSVPSTGQLRITVPADYRDLTTRSQITLKTAPDESVPSGTDFTITVVDGTGATYQVAASALNPLAINRMPGGTNTTLNKIVLQQLTIPTSTITGIDLRDVREIRLTAGVGADGTGTGGVYLSDLAFDTPSVGTPVVQTRTTVNVAPTAVEEGSGPGSAEVAAYLSRADTKPVTGYVSVLGSASGAVGIGMEKVTFQPGETCKTVTVATLGNSAASDKGSTNFKVSATNTSNAVMGAQAFNNLTVREDDGTTGTEIPPVGIQGDACAEYEASLAPVPLAVDKDAVAPGDSFTVTASGFRVGEAVLFGFAGADLGVVIADDAGAATWTVNVPVNSTLGAADVTALGAGSKRDARAAVSVLAPTTTVLAAPTSSTEGEEVAFAATVTGADVEGTVSFTEGDTVLGTADVVDGVATFRYAGLAAGEHTVVASFGQTATAFASVSDPVVITVAAAPVPSPTASPTPGGNAVPAGTGSSSGDLASTGLNVSLWILGSILVLGAGASILVMVRRRRVTE
ncbi:Ig-like domain-containing protein [Cnuibacter physcomitrellae]|uniref:Ig-like domain-containing protein n=1 Tax=Cnuibacter physcomitrellae TaxID=1619308 RepID=UPI002175E368|nr:Ig-like domain-containing protein [Cnuibacter physcomitrellae]MCS5496133.1 Ig-like domain-containing protein [Cnuibacter physcomitrellae]